MVTSITRLEGMGSSKPQTQFKVCQIRVPDIHDPIPAIQVGHQYYSRMKGVDSQQEALEIFLRLEQRGDDAVITREEASYIIWVLEPDAMPDHEDKDTPPMQNPEVYPILKSRQLYRPCHIKVPESDRRVPGIQFEGQFYSFFKVVPDRNRAAVIVKRLRERGERSILTQIAKGYAIWVLELDAREQ